MKLFDKIRNEECPKCGRDWRYQTMKYVCALPDHPEKITWICTCGYEVATHTKDYYTEEG